MKRPNNGDTNFTWRQYADWQAEQIKELERLLERVDVELTLFSTDTELEHDVKQALKNK